MPTMGGGLGPDLHTSLSRFPSRTPGLFTESMEHQQRGRSPVPSQAASTVTARPVHLVDFEDSCDRGVSLAFLEKLVVKQNLTGSCLGVLGGQTKPAVAVAGELQKQKMDSLLHFKP